MKLILAIAPDRFRDEELFVPQKACAEAGVETVIASTKTGTCEGMLGGAAEATVTFAEVAPEAYDGIVIAGGIGSQDFLWGNNDLIRLVQAFAAEGKVVAAICLSPVVLARAGVLKGKKATVFNSPRSVSEIRRGGATLTDDAVVVDGQVVTANGPFASEAFAAAVLSLLSP
ncbi:DJ-1/PfpI family protein [Methanofollis sp. UBA420]|jgi:protease I|uniref:DJ-1/PfpI family protein n=1 Tax=Methanofollis sp. UBA420 TaxID=1915514 RepID=UPI00316AC690